MNAKVAVSQGRAKAIFRRCVRIVRNVFLLLLAILVAYAAIGMVLSLITVNRSPQSGDEVTIYLETNGVHADITVPTKTELVDWSEIVSPHDTDAFYEANGRYSPFFTCNTWANSALKVCGQKCCLWTPLQQPIFWKYPLKSRP